MTFEGPFDPNYSMILSQQAPVKSKVSDTSSLCLKRVTDRQQPHPLWWRKDGILHVGAHNIFYYPRKRSLANLSQPRAAVSHFSEKGYPKFFLTVS